MPSCRTSRSTIVRSRRRSSPLGEDLQPQGNSALCHARAGRLRWTRSRRTIYRHRYRWGGQLCAWRAQATRDRWARLTAVAWVLATFPQSTGRASGELGPRSALPAPHLAVGPARSQRCCNGGSTGGRFRCARSARAYVGHATGDTGQDGCAHRSPAAGWCWYDSVVGTRRRSLWRHSVGYRTGRGHR